MTHQEADMKEKKDYHKPSIVELGTVADLTRGGHTTSTSDFWGGSSNGRGLGADPNTDSKRR